MIAGSGATIGEAFNFQMVGDKWNRIIALVFLFIKGINGLL